MPTLPGPPEEGSVHLRQAARLGVEKVLNPEKLSGMQGLTSNGPVLVLLAAGKGTRFGKEPKCAYPVGGIPLARHSIDAFRRLSDWPSICVVGHQQEQVTAALGADNVYIHSENPVGGTAYAAYESFCVQELERVNPVLIITMGDRIVPESVFRKLYHTHLAGPAEADLTFLTAIYRPPQHQGKGRILRDAARKVAGILEQKDIEAIQDEKLRHSLNDLTEGNCPLYAIRARPLLEHLAGLTNNNAQRQYYLTDLIDGIRQAGGEIRTITTAAGDDAYDLLCADVTRPADVTLLEEVLKSRQLVEQGLAPGVLQAARTIRADRPSGQVASIAEQLAELAGAGSNIGLKPDQPVAIGISGGRLRIAFMHPDMSRFFGPAWQMPTGAANAAGREQIVVLMQSSEDRRVHLLPTNPEFQEKIGSIPADAAWMYPGAEVADWHTYEGFGTRMAEQLLLSLGYFTDQEIQRRKEAGLPLPPASLWVSASMRRPFSLVGNAIASLRTVRNGEMGAKVQSALGRDSFTGLRIVSGGDIPRGGFSSSSAVTVATKNALNALFDFGISPDMLVHLSCQAEYGTGVRAGSLDQATEQKGRAGLGTLISSNPRDHYRVIGAYPVPADRFQVLFPYSVDRDRAAWRWSAGVYSAAPEPGKQTTGELRKLTGKVAELAAILLRLPLSQDFFSPLETDLVADGLLEPDNYKRVIEFLRALPLRIPRDELQVQINDRQSWYIDQLREEEKLDLETATTKTKAVFDNLFAGWRDPVLRRTDVDGRIVQEQGVPLRAMVAYLFGEVAKNFYLIHHPAEWIAWVTRSQRGDCCFEIDPDRLPDAAAMRSDLDWEKGRSGPALLESWLERVGARPFDFNRGLDDATLSSAEPPPCHHFEGTNFFRGLALIDLVEAMLKRAFGKDAVAVRVNAAGQGDFFQVHVDTTQARISNVKEFIRQAFYRRFGLAPEDEFVEPHPGGGAVGVRLERFDQVPALIQALGDDLKIH